MDRKTGRKYVTTGKLPSQVTAERAWRTHEDAFSEVWDEVCELLSHAPELEAKTVFEYLLGREETSFSEGQLRTFQRRVKWWRATQGPHKEIYFAQQHRPGEAMQTDFTDANELGITIAGEPFAHLLCHVVLPYSNWGWATICMSESMAAITVGLQEAVFRIGKVTEWQQTDNSTAATHVLKGDERARGFNEVYLALMRHLGMKPRTIAVGQSNQNGDVEALNGALKRRLKQHLLMRGDCDFASVDAYRVWLHAVLVQANTRRQKRFAEELAVMKPLTVARLPEYKTCEVPVTSWSTIRVQRNTYSVPSRLMGERVKVRVYEASLEVWFAQSCQLSISRLPGSNGAVIDYRHMIWSLVRKPGAFERYKYREAMFPTLVFRRAYDALLAKHAPDTRKADLEYLRILHLAASINERDVEMAAELLLDDRSLSSADDVKALVGCSMAVQVPDMQVPVVDLTAYDVLLREAP